MTAAQVAELLEATPTRDGWASGCPVCGHGSGRRIAIGEGDDGRTLIYPRCGCLLDDVLGAVGMTTQDLFPGASPDPDPATLRRRLAAERLEGWRQAELTRTCETLRDLDRLAGIAHHAVTAGLLDDTNEAVWGALATAYHLRTVVEHDHDRLNHRDPARHLEVWRELRGRHATA